MQVTINTGENKVPLQAPKGRQLKGLLSDANIFYSYPCGGTGRCGKCKVRFLQGAPTPNSLDKSFLLEKEIAQGFRLLCRCVLEKDCEIDLSDKAVNEEEIVVSTSRKPVNKEPMDKASVDKWGIAIDIGTTTIAALLVGKDKENKFQVFDMASSINHQREMGTDVIARIAAACEGQQDKLQSSIRRDLAAIIKELVERTGVKSLDTITITGNTTMLHLLRGEDVSGLGKYPYKTGNLKGEKLSVSELLGPEASDFSKEFSDKTRVLTMPGISAYVGADIVSGIYTNRLYGKRNTALLLDLGTNGEMAFWDGEKLKVTSTAAGPVFEGYGISCGVPAVPGAISHIYWIKEADKFRIKYETIKQKEPVGLCGTGVLEAVSELVRNKIVDETGLLTEEYFEKGFPITEDGKIRITQQDIRNVQLAKAALYAAQIELLQDKTPEYIYVCGGFVSGLSHEKVKHLKLFPWNNSHVFSAGNAALEGAFVYLMEALKGPLEEKKADEELETIARKAETVELVKNSDFAENYVEAMNF